jgi:excisionase family DNA binding protein
MSPQTKISDLTLVEFTAFMRSIMKPANNVMDIDDVSELTGYSKNTVYSLVKQRKIPFSKTGRKLFFERSKIEDWVLSNHVVTHREKFNQVLNKIRK